MITGSISHGTLRTLDLLEAFADTLETLDKERNAHLIGLARADIERLNANGEASDEQALDTLESLFNELEALAPEGYRFGAHEGDGSDFGFWPIEE